MLYRVFHNLQIYLILAAGVASAAVFVVGGAAYRGAAALEKQKLIEQAEVLVLSLDAREVSFLVGDSSDLDNPFYDSLKQRLKSFREADDNIRFIYLAGMRGGEVFFYLDSEPDNSPDYSPPGEKYPEASPVFKEVFEVGLPRFEGPLRDRFGEWVSAFVPLNHPETGKRLAVLGVDVKASNYRKSVALSIATPVLLVILFFLVFLIGYIRYRKEEELLLLKAEFLSIASHDLRAPLTGVLWAIESLRQFTVHGKDSRIDESLGKIEYTIQFMKENIQGILDSSWLMLPESNRESVSTVDVAEVVKSVVEGLMFTARKRKVSIILDKSFNNPVLTTGVKWKLSHVFSNLVSNAIKYSREGSVIKVKYVKERRHVISVEDNGLGIPKGEQKKIFSGHFRASNAAHLDAYSKDFGVGAGLGLYLTKRLVDDCGGEIWFVSKENAGTKFYVELPAI